MSRTRVVDEEASGKKREAKKEDLGEESRGSDRDAEMKKRDGEDRKEGRFGFKSCMMTRDWRQILVCMRSRGSPLFDRMSQ
jgi:hypothetical protein